MTLAIILIVATFLGAGVFLVYMFKTRVFIWTELKAGDVSLRYLCPKDVTHEHVVFAVTECVKQLDTVWPHSKVVEALSTVSIFVVAAPSWKNAQGQTVGGEQDGPVLKVCQDLSSLYHEAAHWLQQHSDQVTEYNHESWTKQRIWDGDNNYRLALNTWPKG